MRLKGPERDLSKERQGEWKELGLIVSCKRHELDPFANLRDILTRLPAMLPTATPKELAALLPHRRQPPR